MSTLTGRRWSAANQGSTRDAGYAAGNCHPSSRSRDSKTISVAYYAPSHAEKMKGLADVYAETDFEDDTIACPPPAYFSPIEV